METYGRGPRQSVARLAKAQMLRQPGLWILCSLLKLFDRLGLKRVRQLSVEERFA